MQENSYLILGVSENATIKEVETAYKNLKEKYKKEYFQEGETGNLAAKMLSKIRVAYADCVNDIQKRNVIGEGSIYEAVDKLVKEGMLKEAQEILDDAEPRDGEWHFAQAHIFYKRNWFLESRMQVEMALTLDPDNAKYLNTLEILKRQQYKIDDEQKSQRQARAGYAPPRETGGAMGNGLCSYCATCLLCNAICYFCI
ncbi:MAG: hypothetical protein OSJ74_03000 [Clostridia bacterium]|nr:hypothetical protein [Clostridia bacterium]